MRFYTAKRLALSGVRHRLRMPENAVGRYQELYYLAALLDLLEINCVIDVGANQGQFASELRTIGYQGFIVSFEPVERVFSALEAAFRGDPRWRGYRIALGSESGTGTINVIPNLTVMSSLLTPRGRWTKIEQEIVEIRRLDDLLDEILSPVPDPRVFLKMDTQGYDLQVFRGAGACTSRIHGLQSELAVKALYDGMPTYTQSLAEYQAAGFELFNLTVVSRGAQGELQELNCFMRQSAGVSRAAPSERVES